MIYRRNCFHNTIYYHVRSKQRTHCVSYVNIARKNGHRLLTRPHRHAGFAVLKSTDVPSVLIELGFLSNVNDIKLLTKEKTRLRLLVSLAEAIELFAKKRGNFN